MYNNGVMLSPKGTLKNSFIIVVAVLPMPPTDPVLFPCSSPCCWAVTCRDDLVKIADYSLASPNALEARDLSMVLAMSFTAGRGDDVRERRLCELTPPLLRTCIGEILHADFSRQSKGCLVGDNQVYAVAMVGNQ